MNRRIDWRSRKIGKYDIGSPERRPAQIPERKQTLNLERKPVNSSN